MLSATNTCIFQLIRIEGGNSIDRSIALHNIVGYSTSGQDMPEGHMWDHSEGVEKGNQLANLKLIFRLVNQVADGSNVGRVGASDNVCSITQTLGVRVQVSDEQATLKFVAQLTNNNIRQIFCITTYNDELGGDGRNCILSQVFALVLRIFLEM